MSRVFSCSTCSTWQKNCPFDCRFQCVFAGKVAASSPIDARHSVSRDKRNVSIFAALDESVRVHGVADARQDETPLPPGCSRRATGVSSESLSLLDKQESSSESLSLPDKEESSSKPLSLPDKKEPDEESLSLPDKEKSDKETVWLPDKEESDEAKKKLELSKQ